MRLPNPFSRSTTNSNRSPTMPSPAPQPVHTAPSAALLALLVLIALFHPLRAPAEIVLAEDFDGGAINSTWAFTNTGGAAPSVVDVSPVPNAMAARITSLSGSINNSLAFDAVPLRGARLIAEIEFRMTDDAANTTAGGCCGEAADGFAFGFFDTATYGATGAANPGASGQQWEDPTVAGGFPSALVVGLDVYDGGGPNGNNVRVTGPAGTAAVLHSATAPFPLNNNLFHRARLTATAGAAGTLLDLVLVEDVNGTAIEHTLFSNVAVSGFDLASVSARLIVGARTGGAFVQTEIDNISIDVAQGEDLDGDGIPDFWEEQFGVDDPGADPDEDDLTNLQEYNAGTDPNDPDTDGDTLRDGVETATGTYLSPADTGTSPIDPDSDDDGLADNVETTGGSFVSAADTGTDPNNPDSDGDGFEDGAEVAAGTDPNDRNDFPSEPIFLGLGTPALLGGDLTDPENDGDPQADINYNATFAASEEAAFGAGEAAFNVFDNLVGGGDDKWCCGDGATAFPTNPLWVSATFDEPVQLTHFTISSANDTPTRDPRVWEIQGSEDGVNFETIFRQDDPATPVWTQRLEVLRFNAGVHFQAPPAYTTLRFICFATGAASGARYQLGELEFFGVPGNIAPLQISEVELGGGVLEISWNSKPGKTYILEWSTDGETWNEIDDSYASAGDITSYSYDGAAGTIGPVPDPATTPTILLRVTENES